MSETTESHLKATVAALLSPDKGILAVDESLPTSGKRFAALGNPSTGAIRRAYLEQLFTTPQLSAICRAGGVPWRLSFSFGHALPDRAMKTWKGSPANTAAAQAALLHRACSNGLVVQGEYSAEIGRKPLANA